jgi:hypothetical protein
MGIDDFHTKFRQLFNKPLGGYISPEEIDNYLEMVLWQFATSRVGSPEKYAIGKGVTNNGYSISQRVKDDLSTLETPSTLTVTAGVATLPVDYFYLLEIHLPQGRSFDINPSANRTNVEIIDNGAWTMRLQDQLLEVSEDYPIALQFENLINVAPNTITSIDITYLRKPLKPKWNYTVVSDRPVYNPTGSVQIDMVESTHNDLLMKTLKLAGMQLKDGEMYGLATQEERNN